MSLDTGIRKRETASITAQNTFTTWLFIDADDILDVSISGTFVANVTIQRSFDNGTTPMDITTETGTAITFTAPAEFQIRGASKCAYRVGVKTGGFTSGTVVVLVQAK